MLCRTYWTHCWIDSWTGLMKKCGMKDNTKISERNNWIHGSTIYCLENPGEGVNLFEYNQNTDTDVKETE